MSGAGQEDRRTLDLFSAHRLALTRYAGAEDVVQEAWLKLQDAGDPASIREPLGYLYRIVRNLAIDARRVLARPNGKPAFPKK